jgi:hypothetical protein
MLGKSPIDDHRELFRTRPADWIRQEPEPALWANKMDRNSLEDAFKNPSSEKPDRSSMPLRYRVDIRMLKHLYRPGDERMNVSRSRGLTGVCR